MALLGIVPIFGMRTLLCRVWCGDGEWGPAVYVPPGQKKTCAHLAMCRVLWCAVVVSAALSELLSGPVRVPNDLGAVNVSTHRTHRHTNFSLTREPCGKPSPFGRRFRVVTVWKCRPSPPWVSWCRENGTRIEWLDPPVGPVGRVDPSFNGGGATEQSMGRTMRAQKIRESAVVQARAFGAPPSNRVTGPPGREPAGRLGGAE